MENFATVEDVMNLYGPLNADQIAKVEQLLSSTSSYFRTLAKEYGRDLNQEVIDDEDMKNNAKLATCNVVIRELDKGNSSLSQESQSALGYTWSGTYVNTGGGLSILNKDLKLLGLNRQRIGMVDIYGVGV